MNKLIIVPKVVIYQNFLDNTSEVFSMIKDSEGNFKEGNVMGQWGEWAALWKGKSCKVKHDLYELKDSDDDLIISQKNIINQIYKTFDIVVHDYVSMFKDDEGWYSFIKSWDIDNEPWKKGSYFDFLKYNLDQPEEMAKEPLAMNYHMDYNAQDSESPLDKLAITVTMYVNDNYEGGEISIYDPISKKVYSYKPKAGDITVFPSGMDYFHGVLPFSGNDRYLIRTFMEYRPEGTEYWFKKVEEYGYEKWIGMEKERLSQGRIDGVNLRNIVAPGKDPRNLRLQSIYLDEDPIYIDGTKNV